MTINYAYLILAVVLLWMPRQWLRAGRRAARKLGLRRHKRDFGRLRETGDNRVNFIEEFSKPRNYIDFLRALTGGLILIGNADWGVSSCFGSVTTLHGPAEDVFWWEVRIAIIAVGVVLQFVRFEGRITFYAPLFFFAGLSCAMCGWGAGSFAFLLVWVLNTALPIPPVGFLAVYSLLLWLLGILFQGLSNRYIHAAPVMFLAPVVVSLMARRQLALFSKKMR